MSSAIYHSKQICFDAEWLSFGDISYTKVYLLSSVIKLCVILIVVLKVYPS